MGTGPAYQPPVPCCDRGERCVAPCVAPRRQIIRSGLEFRLELQRAVSVNKRRFVDPAAGGGAAGGGLDLDLTHICDRVIGMAIPCVEGAVYRNDIREVRTECGERERWSERKEMEASSPGLLSRAWRRRRTATI